MEFEAPSLTAAEPMERLREMENYLWYLKERLEFVLSEIGMENFSQDFRRRLGELGADISGARDAAGIGEQRAASAEGKSLTVRDVINSEMYRESMEDMKSGICGAVAEGGSGYLGLCDGTVVLYGTAGMGGVVFKEVFGVPPVVLTMPQVEVNVGTGGFTADGAGGFQWVAIGRRKEGAGNGD